MSSADSRIVPTHGVVDPALTDSSPLRDTSLQVMPMLPERSTRMGARQARNCRRRVRSSAVLPLDRQCAHLTSVSERLRLLQQPVLTSTDVGSVLVDALF